ncbi:hypothetical protein HOY82DRAFT_539094 [Tuber indicum]|nr:hypothetical protein HOY82DRAFT_539094 [Tuber indicum]
MDVKISGSFWKYVQMAPRAHLEKGPWGYCHPPTEKQSTAFSSPIMLDNAFVTLLGSPCKWFSTAEVRDAAPLQQHIGYHTSTVCRELNYAGEVYFSTRYRIEYPERRQMLILVHTHTVYWYVSSRHFTRTDIAPAASLCGAYTSPVWYLTQAGDTYRRGNDRTALSKKQVESPPHRTLSSTRKLITPFDALGYHGTASTMNLGVRKTHHGSSKDKYTIVWFRKH